jgi:hypothetical protein
VSQVTSFGHQLHISGEDATLLAQSVQRVCQDKGLQAHAAQSTLEDAFLHLTQKAKP